MNKILKLASLLICFGVGFYVGIVLFQFVVIVVAKPFIPYSASIDYVPLAMAFSLLLVVAGFYLVRITFVSSLLFGIFLSFMLFDFMFFFGGYLPNAISLALMSLIILLGIMIFVFGLKRQKVSKNIDTTIPI